MSANKGITREQIEDALKKCDSIRSAARSLGITNSTMRERIGHLGISRNGNRPTVQNNQRITRKTPVIDVDAFNAHMVEWAKRKPDPIERKKQTPINKKPHMLELSLLDPHFGKYGWGAETGEDYDSNIAATAHANGVTDLIDRVCGYKIDRVLLPIGNDFYHVNSWIGETVNGTAMDVDTRFQKVFDTGCMAAVLAVEKCVAIAPTKVLWVPGNHDTETSFYLVRFLSAWFRNVRGVDVDLSPKFRKYELYGKSLIGFTHGSEEPHRDLPAIMAAEEPEKWAKATTREWHVGHEHKKKQTRYSAGDTYGGVGVTVLPSLSGTDAWHYRKGYVKTNRAAEAHLWGKDDGHVGYFSANVRV